MNKIIATNMSFGEALVLLKKNHRMARSGWNGKGMYVALHAPSGKSKMTEPYLYMSNAQGGLIPWLASQSDVLANDWVFFDEKDVQNCE